MRRNNDLFNRLLFLLIPIFSILFNFKIIEAETLLIPQELFNVAKKINCSQIIDFYNRPGMIEPPFIYGYAPGLKQDSFAFWCKSNDKQEFNLVVIKKKPDSESIASMDIIPSKNYPGGLSILSDTNISLDEFFYIEDPHKKGPKGIKLNHNGIRSYYDGVETIFYCFEGKWLVRQRH